MSSGSRLRLPRLTIHFRIKDRNCAGGGDSSPKARYSRRMRAGIVIMHHSEFLRPDSSTLLITIRADCAKRDETGHTGLPPPRGKTRVEWRSGASAGPGLHTRRELFAAQKTSRRNAVREKGRRGGGGCEREKEYETEQLKLGMVPTCAYNIRQKFVNASRPPGRRFGFSRHVYLALAQVCGRERERERDRYVRIV